MKTNEQLVKEWITSMKVMGKVNSDKTLIYYQREVPYFLNFCNKNAVEIKREDVEAYVQHLLDDRKLADSSVNPYIQAVKSFYTYLIEVQQIISVNPTDKIGRKKSQKVDRYLSKNEIDSYLAKCDECSKVVNKKLKAFMGLLITSGLRFSEATSIRYEDIMRYTSDDGLVYGSCVITGKGNKQRELMILPNVLTDIDDYYFNERPETNRTELFVNRDGGEWQNSSVGRTAKMLARKCGLKDFEKIHPHTMRHTFASSLINNGTDITVIQKLMGHANIETTLRYITVSKETQNNAIKNAFM